MPLRGGLCRKVVFASLRGAKVKRFLRWTGLKAGGFLSLTAAYGHACGVRIQRVQKVHRVQRVAVLHDEEKKPSFPSKGRRRRRRIGESVA